VGGGGVVGGVDLLDVWGGCFFGVWREERWGVLGGCCCGFGGLCGGRGGGEMGGVVFFFPLKRFLRFLPLGLRALWGGGAVGLQRATRCCQRLFPVQETAGEVKHQKYQLKGIAKGRDYIGLMGRGAGIKNTAGGRSLKA